MRDNIREAFCNGRHEGYRTGQIDAMRKVAKRLRQRAEVLAIKGWAVAADELNSIADDLAAEADDLARKPR